ncbi:MAG: SDR family oxidoreductase [Actinobacteria bacterium]|nr:SDR family oxidoreductase [Actinomycetota bacterium]
MNADEDSKVALVAGASGGVGRVIAARLAVDGYDLALTYLDEDEHAERVAAKVREDDRRVELLPRVDLGDDEAAAAMVAEASARFGRIDLVVYAAGPWIPLAWISTLDPKKMREVVEADALGCFNLLRAAVAPLRETRGAVVALTTPALRRHANQDTMSSAPKAYIEALIRGVASEEGRNGIRANSVGCGITEGPGLVQKLIDGGYFDDAYFDAVRHNVALGRMARPEEIAEAVAFLASPIQAGYITGQSLVVDGGYTA